jgi:glyoxylase I family protein
MNERRMRITGIHHITLLVQDLNRSGAFYRNVLGLRLVKQTVNDDDQSARHFIFGDADRMLITCLEYPDLDEGKVGRGSTHHFALAVDSEAELQAWKQYLGEKGIPTTDVMDRGDFRSIYLRDPDGHIIEIAT